MKGVVIVLLLVLFTAGMPADSPPGALPHPPTNPHETERARIQRHLARVELELLGRDVSELTPDQQSARREQIRRLREYRLASTFPHNYQFPNRRIPYFMDERGTLCAMAYLIACSGGRDLVDQVARYANNARVAELASDPVLGRVLGSWLDKSGLTVQEAQRIQPSYDYDRPQAPKRISVAYGTASGAVGALNVASVVLNSSHRSPRWIPWAGLAAGSAGVVLGASKLDHAMPVRTLGIANIMVGGTSIVASASALLRRRDKRVVSKTERGVEILVAAGVDRFFCPVAGLRAAF